MYELKYWRLQVAEDGVYRDPYAEGSPEYAEGAGARPETRGSPA